MMLGILQMIFFSPREEESFKLLPLQEKKPDKLQFKTILDPSVNLSHSLKSLTKSGETQEPAWRNRTSASAYMGQMLPQLLKSEK